MVGEGILARGRRPQSMAGDLSVTFIIWQLTRPQSQSADRRQGGSHSVVGDPVPAATMSFPQYPIGDPGHPFRMRGNHTGYGDQIWDHGRTFWR